MKFKKRILSIILILAISVPVGQTIAVYAASPDKKQNKIDDLDLILIAQEYLSGTEEDLWYDDFSIKDIKELYDENGEIYSYYISFLPSGYAIINADLDNPIALEFGEGEKKELTELMNTNRNTKIFYDSGSVCELTNLPTLIGSNKSLISDKSELKSVDSEQKMLHQQRREKALEMMEDTTATVKADTSNQIKLYSTAEELREKYGMIDFNDLPSGSYTSDWLSLYGITWATDDLLPNAENCCGCVTATNIVNWYANTKYSGLLVNGSLQDTIDKMYTYTGDGPEITIAPDVKNYCTSMGYTCTTSSVGNTTAFKNAIANDLPLGVLLCAGISDWHWVLGVGYREYTGGDFYIRNVNTWDDYYNYYVKWNGTSLTISCTSYTIKE